MNFLKKPFHLNIYLRWFDHAYSEWHKKAFTTSSWGGTNRCLRTLETRECICGMSQSRNHHTEDLPDLEQVVCPTCGPMGLEDHPRFPGVRRCVNCKEHLKWEGK